MNNDDRIYEVLADMLIIELKAMRMEMNGLRSDVDDLKQEQAKTNLSIQELRLSVMKLAEQVPVVMDHEARIRILENKLLKP